MNYQRLLMLLAFVTGITRATTNQELFLRAHSLYHECQYQKALDSYQAISNKTSVVFYDIGLCFYKLGKLGHALWGLKQALRMATRTDFDTIVHAIDQIQKLLEKEPEKLFRHTVCRSIRRTTAGTTLLQWQIVLLLCVYLMCLVYVYRRRQWWMVLLAIIGGCGLIISVPVSVVKWVDQSTTTAIVAVERLEIFSGPYQDCHVQGTLDYAQEIVILDACNDWYKIKSGTIIGWVVKKSVMPVI